MGKYRNKKGIYEIMTEQELLSVLKEHKQEHIYAAYQKLDEEGKKKLAGQVERIDWSIVDMAGYEELKQERGKLEPLSALEVPEIEKNKEKYSEIGIDAIKAGKVGAVLLAGGQGTRLGSDGPKGKYNIGITKDMFIFLKIALAVLSIHTRFLERHYGIKTEKTKKGFLCLVKIALKFIRES